MQSLISNKDNIIKLREKVETLDRSLFTHYVYDTIPIYEDTISIVMTSSNRSKQVYHTLETIQKCSFKHIQVIIVDDSDVDPIAVSALYKFPFYIDLVFINRQNKNWINPVINYNLGFKLIRGSKVVIQNGEVCYVGDVLGFISNNIKDNNYYIFDVKAISSLENNEIIYNNDNLTTEIYKKDIYSEWYQNRIRCVNYHFLTALTRNTFNLILNFSYDYAFGKDYDDNDFVIKILSRKINIVNIFNDIYNLGGIHLYHNSCFNNVNIESNNKLFEKKRDYYNLNNIYIDFIDNMDKFI